MLGGRRNNYQVDFKAGIYRCNYEYIFIFQIISVLHVTFEIIRIMWAPGAA